MALSWQFAAAVLTLSLLVSVTGVVLKEGISPLPSPIGLAVNNVAGGVNYDFEVDNGTDYFPNWGTDNSMMWDDIPDGWFGTFYGFGYALEFLPRGGVPTSVLKLYNLNNDLALISTDVRIENQKKYWVSIWIKTQLSSGWASIITQCARQSHAPLTPCDYAHSPPTEAEKVYGTANWTQVKYVVEGSNQYIYYLRPTLSTSSDAIGTAWFDLLQVVEVPPAPQALTADLNCSNPNTPKAVLRWWLLPGHNFYGLYTSTNGVNYELNEAFTGIPYDGRPIYAYVNAGQEYWFKVNAWNEGFYGEFSNIAHIGPVNCAGALTADAGGPYTTTVNQPFNLTATASGGTTPYTYSWSISNANLLCSMPAGCINGTPNPVCSGVSCQRTGTATVTLTVTDNQNTQATDTALLTVEAGCLPNGVTCTPPYRASGNCCSGYCGAGSCAAFQSILVDADVPQGSYRIGEQFTVTGRATYGYSPYDHYPQIINGSPSPQCQFVGGCAPANPSFNCTIQCPVAGYATFRLSSTDAQNDYASDENSFSISCRPSNEGCSSNSECCSNYCSSGVCSTAPPANETPSTPSNLRVTATGNSTVSLAWNSATGTDYYRLRYKAAVSINWTEAQSNITSTQHTVSNLMNGVVFEFQVKACNQLANPQCSSWSASVQGTPAAAPQEPECNDGLRQGTEQCDPPAAESPYCPVTPATICDYEQLRYGSRELFGECSSNCLCVEPAWDWNSSTAAGSPYCLSCATCGDGECNCAEDALSCPGDCGGAIDNTPPAAPRNLSALAGNERVSLSWSANTETDLSYYTAYYGFSPEELSSSLVSFSSPFTVGELSNSVEYFFAVSAVDTSGNESSLSSIVSSTPQQPIGSEPLPPTNLSASFTGSAIVLTWLPVAPLPDAFKVYKSEGSAPYSLTATLSEFAFADTSFGKGKTYSYKVSSLLDGVESALSNPVSVSIPAAPQLQCDKTANNICLPSCERSEDPDCLCNNDSACDAGFESTENCPKDCPLEAGTVDYGIGAGMLVASIITAMAFYALHK